jgi:sorbitol-6-phosphate 2-dehydrogenase
VSSLANKVAIVTGAAQGLGEAIALRLAQEGCDVVVADVNEARAGEAAASIAAETGRRVLPVKVDVTHESDVESLFDRAVEELGRVDIVVANAGILIAEPIDTADAGNWRAVMDVNLFGYFLTTKHACRVMKRQRSGAIVSISSKSGKRGSAANSAYAASKFGGIGHTQSVALEMAQYNVRCNAVCPGNLLDSPLWTDPEKGLALQYFRAGKVPGATSPDDVLRAYADQVPMKRGCTYDDVCNAVVFLSSDQSGYITGIALSVTGGQEMN